MWHNHTSMRASNTRTSTGGNAAHVPFIAPRRRVKERVWGEHERREASFTKDLISTPAGAPLSVPATTFHRRQFARRHSLQHTREHLLAGSLFVDSPRSIPITVPTDAPASASPSSSSSSSSARTATAEMSRPTASSFKQVRMTAIVFG